MVTYNCFRCGYSVTNKSRFKQHLFRKHTCQPKLKNISIGQVIEQYKFLNLKKKNDEKIITNYDTHCCESCYQKIIELETYNTFIRQEILDMKIQFEILLNDLENRLSKQFNTVNKSNCNNNTTTNNIIINNFGQESQRFLSNTMLSGLINNTNVSVPRLIEKIKEGHEEVHQVTDTQLKHIKNNLDAIQLISSLDNLDISSVDDEFINNRDDIIEDVLTDIIDSLEINDHNQVTI